MPQARKRPCSICRRWFRPDPRVGDRQHACQKPECQAARRKKTQARWRAANPDYAAAYRIQQRQAQEQAPEPLRVPAPLNRLPWIWRKTRSAAKPLIFWKLWVHSWCAPRKTRSARKGLIPGEFPEHFPRPPRKISARRLHTDAEAMAAMRLDRRWERLRACHPARQRRLLASLAESGQ